VNRLLVAKGDGIMKFKPLYDRVLVERTEAESKTSGGIIIPDTAKEKPIEGIVVAVGSGMKSEKTGDLIPLQVKSGDKILFGKWSGTEIKLDGKDYLVMKESDIVGIFE
jgi:chaperonin GroES